MKYFTLPEIIFIKIEKKFPLQERILMVSTVAAIVQKIVPIALSILGCGVLIVIHELGHFLFCKLFNIYVPSFSVGFGPKIFEKKIGETTFRLAQIPLGGYVEIAVQEEIAQEEQKLAHDISERLYAKKYYWQKIFVWLGGIVFNLIFAYLTFIVLFLCSPKKNNNVLISAISKDSPAEISGLKSGDEILAINDLDLASHAEKNPHTAQKLLLQTIQENPNQKVSLLIRRAQGKEQSKSDNKEAQSFVTQEIQVQLGSRIIENDKSIGILGAYFPPIIQKLPFKYAVIAGIETTNAWIGTVGKSLLNIFVRKSLDGAGGPLMMFAQGSSAAQQGIGSFFIFLALLSITLAVFNLLPLGILDGGQLLFATIEFIIRRPLPDKVRVAINITSLVVFVGLTLYLTYRDIGTIFGSNLTYLYQKLTALVK